MAAHPASAKPTHLDSDAPASGPRSYLDTGSTSRPQPPSTVQPVPPAEAPSDAASGAVQPPRGSSSPDGPRASTAATQKPGDVVGRSVERAANLLGLGVDTVRALRMPEREMMVKVPYRRADGGRGVAHGFRVQHNTARGPAKGGLRYHPGVGIDEVRDLAEVMSYKTSLVGLPFGGAKGGIAVDPTALTCGEKEDLTREFVRRLAPVLGPHRDVPAPDAGTDAETMSWIVDEYGRHCARTGASETAAGCRCAVVTGKPLRLGGAEGREEATGRGVTVVTAAALAAADRSLDGARVVIQGLGNVGGYAAQLFDDAGADVVGVGDATGTLFFPDGADVRALRTYVASTGGIDGYARDDARPIPTRDLWRIDCDVLVPAALGGVIDAEVAADVEADLVVEGANLPTTPEGDEVLARRGIPVVPDLLANAGGVIVSYVEWEQNVRQTTTTLAATRRRLTRILRRRFDDVRQFAQRHSSTLRTSAYALGLQGIVEEVGR